MKNTEKMAINSTTLDVAGMGSTAWGILENFIGGKKIRTLRNALINNPRIRITVSFYKGSMFAYSGIENDVNDSEFDINKINF